VFNKTTDYNQASCVYEGKKKESQKPHVMMLGPGFGIKNNGKKKTQKKNLL